MAKKVNSTKSPMPPAKRPLQRLLVVEDMEDARLTLQELLELRLNIDVDAAIDGHDGLEKLLTQQYSLCITDLRMPKLDGIRMIEEVRKRNIPVTIIVTTGHGNVKDAVTAMRHGAYDFVTKPADPDYLCMVVQRALNERLLQDEITALKAQLQGQHSFQNILSKSQSMIDVFELIENISTTTSTVLIVGETGTGKEQVARAIHNASTAHRSGNFIAVNCAAIPETLLESELFGHEKGSFTGAISQRKGRFEQAHLGTLFLDEVGDIPMSMQVKLLRVLQERRIERVGGAEPIEIDTRVIAATHQPLEERVAEGLFREDLYYRLNVIRIPIPPLRDRQDDIPLLAGHFVMKYARNRAELPEISAEAMEQLLNAPWPGNVRQLENAIERACITCKNGLITPKDLPGDSQLAPSRKRSGRYSIDLRRTLPDQLSELVAAYEERYLKKALRKTRGHVGRCAKMTGLSRRSITDKIAQYNIDKSEYKKD